MKKKLFLLLILLILFVKINQYYYDIVVSQEMQKSVKGLSDSLQTLSPLNVLVPEISTADCLREYSKYMVYYHELKKADEYTKMVRDLKVLLSGMGCYGGLVVAIKGYVYYKDLLNFCFWFWTGWF